MDAVCEQCIDERCCTERLDCGEEAQCVELRDCFNNCLSDVACERGCTSTIGATTTNGAFVTCRGESCGVECAANVCVGEVEWPGLARPEYVRNVLFADFQTGTPVAGAAVRICDKNTDLDCENPVAEATTNAEGVATFTLPTAPDGISVFFALEADGYLDSDFWFAASDPEGYLEAGAMSWNVISDSTADLISGLLGVTPDESRGIITFIANDCNRNAVAGLEVSVESADAGTSRMYLEGGFPDASRTTTARGGAGAFFNVPAGQTRIASEGPDATRWGQVRVNVRPGRVLGMNVVPSPLED